MQNYRPSDLRLRNVSSQGTKKPSPSPTRRISQPNPPAPGFGGSPIRARRGSNPATPTGSNFKPIHESSSSNTSTASGNPMDRSNMQASLNNVSVTPTRYPRPRLRHTHSQCISSKKRTNHQFCHKRGNSLSLSRQKDYSSETELKVIEENIVNNENNKNNTTLNRKKAWLCIIMSFFSNERKHLRVNLEPQGPAG